MYSQIAKMTPVARIYEQQLLEKGTIDATKLAAMKKTIRDEMEVEYVKSKELVYNKEEWLTAEWDDLKHAKNPEKTGLDLERFKDIG
jgi:2-oxoglutarate dehydrogenase complex dehydrogenase (E1) component-like enzyme